MIQAGDNVERENDDLENDDFKNNDLENDDLAYDELNLLGKILVHWGNFARYRFLLQDLIVRDIKVKYRRSVLGILWSVLNPLLMMLVITAVFNNVFRMFEVPNFPVYYLTGILIFSFVSEATTGSMFSVLGGGSLIKKVYIPKYIFPLEKCLFALVNMMFSAVAVVIVMLITGAPIYPTILLFWIPMLYALIFSIGLGLILATLAVFFRDVTHLYSVWVTAWMFLTPIIYPVEALSEGMRNSLRFNPLYHFVNYFRDVVRYGRVPGLQENLICLGIALAFLVVGLVVFKWKQKRFILYM